MEDRGAFRRDSPKGTTSCGVTVEEAAGRDLPKKALHGIGVDDGGGEGVAVDDCGGGRSQPSGEMTRGESTRSKTPRIRQVAACCLLLSSYCPVPSSCLVAVLAAVSAWLSACRCCLLPRYVCVASCYWYSYSYFFVYLVLLLYQVGPAQLNFYLIKDRSHYRIRHVYVAPWVFSDTRKLVPCCVLTARTQQGI